METQKKYKHKQTGYIAKEANGGYQIYLDDKTNDSDMLVNRYIIENTTDWGELIETPKMEVVEGKFNTDSLQFIKNSAPIAKHGIESILIKNPPKFLSELLRKIEKGECYEKYSSQYGVSHSYTWQEIRDNENSDFNHKILIIPMEANKDKL